MKQGFPDRFFFTLIFLVGMLWSLMGTGCSSVPKNEHWIRDIVPSHVRARRPQGAGADPKVGPGGTDYQSHPLPDQNLDCEIMATLFREIDLSAVQGCLAELVEDSHEVSYRLRRTVAPYLDLEVTDETPSCLKQSLSRIPVPREVIYQSAKKNSLECYSSRLNIEADEVLGVKVPKARLALVLRFPLEEQPENDADVVRLLTSWALTPFWGDQSGPLRAKLVPTALCSECFGKGKLLKEDEPRTSWP